MKRAQLKSNPIWLDPINESEERNQEKRQRRKIDWFYRYRGESEPWRVEVCVRWSAKSKQQSARGGFVPHRRLEISLSFFSSLLESLLGFRIYLLLPVTSLMKLGSFFGSNAFYCKRYPNFHIFAVEPSIMWLLDVTPRCYVMIWCKCKIVPGFP